MRGVRICNINKSIPTTGSHTMAFNNWMRHAPPVYDTHTNFFILNILEKSTGWYLRVWNSSRNNRYCHISPIFNLPQIIFIPRARANTRSTRLVSLNGCFECCRRRRCRRWVQHMGSSEMERQITHHIGIYRIYDVAECKIKKNESEAKQGKYWLHTRDSVTP